MQTDRPMNGSFVNADGVLFVVYYGRIIAVVDSAGRIIASDPTKPLYLIEHILAIPHPEKVRLN